MQIAPIKAVLVGGSTIDPSRIQNRHIRAHALEGQLFTGTLKEVLEARGIQTSMVGKGNVLAAVSNLLRITERQLTESIVDIGMGTKPWRSEQKLAALAAWMALKDAT